VFTGLVEAKGTLVRRDARGDGARLAIRSRFADDEPLVIGESIAVDGCCLSVVTITRDERDAPNAADEVEIDASSETLARTTLGTLPIGAAMNLERATKVGDRLGGHIVSGHVDGVGAVAARLPLGDAITLAFSVPPALSRFIAEKGSITVNGVSLTVNAVGALRFEVAIIPITRSATNLDALSVGDRVNLEVDLLARYVARLLDV
jgi:riboflavin synthase